MIPLILLILSSAHRETRHKSTLIWLSHTMDKAGNLSDFWICHHQPLTNHGKTADPFVTPVNIFPFLLNYSINQITPSSSTYYVRIVLLPGKTNPPCFEVPPI